MICRPYTRLIFCMTYLRLLRTQRNDLFALMFFVSLWLILLLNGKAM